MAFKAQMLAFFLSSIASASAARVQQRTALARQQSGHEKAALLNQFTDQLDALAAVGQELRPMDQNQTATASKFEYDPRPGHYSSMTLIEMLNKAADAHPDEMAFRTPRQTASGDLVKQREFGSYGKYRYKKTTWKQYRDLVQNVATAFVAMGLQPMDAVHIRGVNSPEWLISFLGCIAAGGLPVGLYPTDSPEALEFKARDSGAAFVMLAKGKDLGVYSKFIDKISTVKAIILWDGAGATEQLPADLTGSLHKKERPLLDWKNFVAMGRSQTASSSRDVVRQRTAALKPGQAATVVYTSGTTGNPKGVMLSHDNVYFAAVKTSEILVKRPRKGEHRMISYLPLNHVAGQMLDIIAPLYLSMQKDIYTTTFFPAMCYFKKKCISEQLADAEPTIFLGVPEVWDGLRLKIDQASKGGVAKFLKNHAPGILLKKIGLGKVMYAITGAGPITKDTLKFFNALGLDILNAFAQSESAALGTAWMSSFFKLPNVAEKFGSIGKPLGNELRLSQKDKEGRGEIQLKGRNVMLGYLNRPEKNTEALTEDGWLKTGDKGKIDSDGFVFLVGRLKEIMKSHGGEMIAPVQVEEGIKKACNSDGLIVKQAIVQGDTYYYLSVLVTLLEEAEEGIPNGKLMGDAKKVDTNPRFPQTVAAAQDSSVWASKLSTCISEYNKVAKKSPERVMRFAILPRDITAEGSTDLMTPTFKIKREGVSEKYADVIESCGGKPENGKPGNLGGVQACPEVARL